MLRKRRGGYKKRNRRRNVERPRSETTLFLFVFLSLILLVLSRLQNAALNEVRGLFADWATPALEAASIPIGKVRRIANRIHQYSDLYTEVDRLKRENSRLRQLEWQAERQEATLSELRSLLNVPKEPELEFATGRIISEGRGSFARSVLLNVGRKRGVKNGYPIVNSAGLVGRIISAGRAASRALLLTDPNSRVPVSVGKDKIRAILAGNGGKHPILELLPTSAGVEEGQEVSTSGDGGLFPRGLRIGVVRTHDQSKYVDLHAELNQLEFATVLFFDTPAITTANRLEENYIRKQMATQNSKDR